MGEPINFDGSNIVMRAPEGAENVRDMHVFQTRHSSVSCWSVSEEELAEINLTGRIFLSVLLGGQQPPVYVGSESACREVLVDFGPVWPFSPKPKPPVPVAIASVWQEISTAPVNTTVLVYWPIVKLDEDGDPTDEIVGGEVFVSEDQGGYWIEPDVMNAIGDHMGDDHTYAANPSHWMPKPELPAGAISEGSADGR